MSQCQQHNNYSHHEGENERAREKERERETMKQQTRMCLHGKLSAISLSMPYFFFDKP